MVNWFREELERLKPKKINKRRDIARRLQLDRSPLDILWSDNCVTCAAIFSNRQNLFAIMLGKKKLIYSLPILYTFTKVYRI